MGDGDSVSDTLECALDVLISITEKSGNLRKDLKQDILKSVSKVREVFVRLKQQLNDKNETILKMQNENVGRTALDVSKHLHGEGNAVPSCSGTAEASRATARHLLPSTSVKQKLFSDALKGNTVKRYKLTLKSKSNQSPDEVKNYLKRNIDPTKIKVGINTFKTLNDGRVLIETSTEEEINALSTKISEKCGEQLDVHVPKLWKPKIIIYNVPDDITVENLEETILVQNPEISLHQGDITPKFKIRTKKYQNHMVIEVGPQTRKMLLQNKLKIGWLICNTQDYLVAKRCFRCSRFNHRHSECRGEETCPLCAGNHKLRECTAPEIEHKCINCIAYNNYSKKGAVCVNHSSLNKNCPSLQAVLMKYKQNTDY